MAMTSSGLKKAIKDEMKNQKFDIDNEATGGEADKYIEALASAIVSYIRGNAEVVDTGTDPAPQGNWPII